MALGKYEILLQKALEQEGPGPWNAHGLDRVRQHLTQDFCLTFDPECDQDAPIDWLNALPREEVTGLVARLNAE